MKLELFYYDQCPFCQKVLRGVDELGLNNKITLRNTLNDHQSRDYHIKKSGRTTVPCLYIDDTPLFESSDILNWLSKNINSI